MDHNVKNEQQIIYVEKLQSHINNLSNWVYIYIA